MTRDAGESKSAERNVEAPSHGAATAVKDQTAPGTGSTKPWTESGIAQQHQTNMDAAGWKPSENLANVPANGPIYRAASAGLLGDINPGSPPSTAMGDRAPGSPPSAAMGDRAPAMASIGKPAETRPGADTSRPAGTPAEATDQQKKVNDMLQSNPELAKQVTEMRGNIEKMDPHSRAIAQQGLDQMLARGTAGPHESYAPQLDQHKITDTLKNLNHAMGQDAQHLNSMMGSDQPPAAGFNKSEREMNRDLTVAQALRNYGDTRGVQQTGHQTCLLDGKVGDQARLSPDKSSQVLDSAMTSRDGYATMPDGHTRVKLNDSFMRPDVTAAHSVGGANAEGMSADVRMLTGTYANALTQRRGQEFRMSADGVGASQNDTGDRLIDMNTGKALKMSSDGRMNLNGQGRYLDSPNVGLDDSIRLNAMTGGDGTVVSNAAAWGQGGLTSTRNFQNVENAGQLKDALDRSGGSVQVGLNAHILFGNGGVGAEGGGHLTSVTGMSADGKMVQIQDTNSGTSGWYSADRVMAAIKNDKSFDTTPRTGENAAIFNRTPHVQGPSEAPSSPGTPGRVGPSGGGERPSFAPESGGSPRSSFVPSNMPDTVANPRGMVDNTTQRDDNLKNAKPETDKEQQSREQQQKEQEEKIKAAYWKSLQQREEERIQEEERKRQQ
jgi:hypothetical protein